jgi:hypothetical protein
VIWNASRKFQQIEYVTARRNGHETLRPVHHPNIPELDKSHHFSFSSCSGFSTVFLASVLFMRPSFGALSKYELEWEKVQGTDFN